MCRRCRCSSAGCCPVLRTPDPKGCAGSAKARHREYAGCWGPSKGQSRPWPHHGTAPAARTAHRRASDTHRAPPSPDRYHPRPPHTRCRGRSDGRALGRCNGFRTGPGVARPGRHRCYGTHHRRVRRRRGCNTHPSPRTPHWGRCPLRPRRPPPRSGGSRRRHSASTCRRPSSSTPHRRRPRSRRSSGLPGRRPPPPPARRGRDQYSESAIGKRNPSSSVLPMWNVHRLGRLPRSVAWARVGNAATRKCRGPPRSPMCG